MDVAALAEPGGLCVSGRVQGCNDKFHTPGNFKVSVTVGADGSVSNVSAGAPMAGTPTGDCVESSIRNARFKKAKSGITFKYPYAFK